MEIFENIYEQIIDFLNSDLIQNILMLVKILSGFISIFLFILLLVLLIQLRGRIKNSLNVLSESLGAPTLPKKKMLRKWDDILKRVETGDENGYKMAVIDADKIFDEILKRIGYKEKDMGERMKNIKTGQISNIDELWQAHKTRNNIVHDPDFKLTRSQAEQAVKYFGKALKELQVI